MIKGMIDTGATPVLERLVQFTGERHRYLTNNVANLSTPDYQPRDLSVGSFQEAMRKAVDERRQRTGGPNGALHPRDTRQVAFGEKGMSVRPEGLKHNILFHDRNNRSLEHTMKDLAENAMMHNAALEMLKSKFTMLESTIREQA